MWIHTLQNNWPGLFINVKGMKDKDKAWALIQVKEARETQELNAACGWIEGRTGDSGFFCSKGHYWDNQENVMRSADQVIVVYWG